MNECIGIDEGKQELVAFDGNRHYTFSNEEGLQALRQFLISKGSSFKVVFEPTSTYSRNLEELCIDLNIPFVAINPRAIHHLRNLEQIRSKSDKSDSQLLYIYGKMDHAGKSAPKDALARKVSCALALYGIVQRNRIALQGALDALRHEPLLPEDFLKLLEDEIGHLLSLEKEILKRAEEIIVEGGQKETLELLRSVPGIGVVLALHLYAFFVTFPNANRKEIVALVGMDAIDKKSGTSVYSKPHISKRGNKRLRKTLFQATLSAARYNPKVKALYVRLKAAGKPDKVARIAAARKLLLIAFAIYKSGKPFVADYPATEGRVRKGEHEERRSDLTCQKEATGTSEYVEVGKNTSSVNSSRLRWVSTNKAVKGYISFSFSP